MKAAMDLDKECEYLYKIKQSILDGIQAGVNANKLVSAATASLTIVCLASVMPAERFRELLDFLDETYSKRLEEVGIT
jgi:hypothetical protein